MGYAVPLLAVLLLTAGAGGAAIIAAPAPAGCLIEPGLSIGGVRIGMTASAAAAVNGRSQVTIEDGFVRRITTRAPDCRTAAGIGVGGAVAAVRQAHAVSPMSTMTTLPDGDLLSYPFAGIAFLIRDQRVIAVEVFRPEVAVGGRSGARGAAPSPPPASAPSPAGPAAAWAVRSLSGRVEGMTFVVTGTIENRRGPASVYAEVSAFSRSGRPLATGDGPATPDPVPAGGAATFEARLSVDDVVRRYVVAVRPVGSITVTLVERSVTVRDVQQFFGLVMQRLKVATTLGRLPRRITVTVINPTSVTVAPVYLIVDVSARCLRVRAGMMLTSPFEWSGPATLGAVFPQGSDAVSVPLPADDCDDLFAMSARARVVGIRLRD